jgi:hypothetical protein
MAKCQLDAVQCVNWIYAEHSVRRSTVAQKTRVSFFLICCATCLWDVVGHFLGCLKTSQARAFSWIFNKSRLSEATRDFIHPK